MTEKDEGKVGAVEKVKGLGSNVAEKIMECPTPIGGTISDVTDITVDIARKTAETGKDAAKKTMEIGVDVVKISGEMGVGAVKKTAEMSKDAAKKTVEISADAVKKTAEMSKDAAKKTVEVSADAVKKTAVKSKEVIVESKKKMDSKIEADRAKDKWEYTLILLNFFGPSMAAILVFVIFFLGLPNSTASRFMVSSFLSFIPLVGDKIALISSAPYYHGHGSYIMAVTIAIMDSLLSWFIVYNIELVKKWGRIGSIIIKIEKQSRSLLDKYLWMRKAAIVFIVIFVMIPFQGSGGLAASIIGRLMGLKPWKVLFSVAAGSLLGCLGIAYMVDTIKKYLSQPVQYTLFIVFIGLITMFFVASYRKEKKAEKMAANGS